MPAQYTFYMKNTLVVAALCILALVVGAWLYFTHTSPATRAETAPAAVATARDVEVTVLDSGTTARTYAVRKNYAIYDAAKFAEIWKAVHGADAKVPTVDFTKEYVLAVFAGEKPTGGYGIQVARVNDTDAARMIGIELTVPGAGCMMSKAKTEPYEFVSVPATGPLTLEHRDVTVTKSCN